jgi:hypothetical protein
MAACGRTSAPVAACGILVALGAPNSYNFIYSWFPSAARSGPSPPSRKGSMRLQHSTRQPNPELLHLVLKCRVLDAEAGRTPQTAAGGREYREAGTTLDSTGRWEAHVYQSHGLIWRSGSRPRRNFVGLAGFNMDDACICGGGPCPGTICYRAPPSTAEQEAVEQQDGRFLTSAGKSGRRAW